jgi:hypothetical protein
VEKRQRAGPPGLTIEFPDTRLDPPRFAKQTRGGFASASNEPSSLGRDKYRNARNFVGQSTDMYARPWRRVAINQRDDAYVKSFRPEGAGPIPVRAGTHRMGTIIVRFVTTLALVIVVLMLVWSR